MVEHDIKSFVESCQKYFEKSTGEAAQIGVPHFLDADEQEALDFTGIIGITGKARGAIYFSASRLFLNTMAEKVFMVEPSDEIILDLVGEIANTLAGNAQIFFPEDFEISLPVVVRGSLAGIQIKKLNEPVVCVPIFWREEKALLTIGINS